MIDVVTEGPDVLVVVGLAGRPMASFAWRWIVSDDISDNEYSSDSGTTKFETGPISVVTTTASSSIQS